MFILLFLLTCFLCVYEDNQSTTRNLKRTFRLLFLFGKSRACTVICQIKKAKSGAVACGGSLSEQEEDGRLQSKRPELLSPPQKSCLHGNLPNKKKQRAERLRVVGVSPSRKKTAVCKANDLNYCLHRKSRACTVICQIKKAKSVAFACGWSLSEREKTAVCTADDLNYCLH